ncbi:uncharacterized protein LOC119187663 [Rhipicephalus microplus]|uniref:uncharacterized protein LOC119187663 n=1 Tax=Rhipicephalus microplus TaxID=6941 RepID=UPI0018887244|nr:uncharacterized protein LOC119187663 [Rhipicephalus microplus]
MSMIMLACILVASVLGQAYGLAGAIYEANNYLDTILGVILPLQVNEAKMTTILLPGFTVNHSDGTGALNLTFDSGILVGFGKHWQRQGDCQAAQWRNENITTTCHAKLDGMLLLLDGTLEDSNSTIVENVTLILIVRNSSARIAPTERKKGYAVHLDLSLEQLSLDVLTMGTLTPLPGIPEAVFKKELNLGASAILRRFIEMEARQGVLRHAFSLIHLPLPQQ